MKVIEVSGSPREIGNLTGEALREEIREHLALFPPKIDQRCLGTAVPTFFGDVENPSAGGSRGT